MPNPSYSKHNSGFKLKMKQEGFITMLVIISMDLFSNKIREVYSKLKLIKGVKNFLDFTIGLNLYNFVNL